MRERESQIDGGFTYEIKDLDEANNLQRDQRNVEIAGDRDRSIEKKRMGRENN